MPIYAEVFQVGSYIISFPKVVQHSLLDLITLIIFRGLFHHIMLRPTSISFEFFYAVLLL
jgi:hypothetical protein